MNTIAILLTCHNRRKKTIECLDSVYKLNIPSKFNLQIFLVDDNSTDGTFEAVRKKFPLVNLIKGTGKLFWNRGMHLAWKCAIKTELNYDFFLWLNDDVILDVDALMTLMRDSSKNGDSIICGVLKSKIFVNRTTYGGKDLKGDLIKPQGYPVDCMYINGNVVLIPNKIVDEIGILDSFYPHAIGDYEYGLRAIKYGFKCMISSTYVGFCENNESLPKWCLPEVNFFERFKSLYSPLANSHPFYFFVYEFKYFGIRKAIKHFISIHLRMFNPKLWK